MCVCVGGGGVFAVCPLTVRCSLLLSKIVWCRSVLFGFVCVQAQGGGRKCVCSAKMHHGSKTYKPCVHVREGVPTHGNWGQHGVHHGEEVCF